MPRKTKSSTRSKPEGQRSYQQLTSVGGINADWPLSVLSEDSDVWQNIFTLRARMRDLWRTNSYFQKYREELWANVFGEHGISCRMKVKETEDRVVHAPDEKWAILLHQRRREAVLQWMGTKSGARMGSLIRRTRDIISNLEERAKATVKVGEIDLYASKLIEDAWKDWKNAQYCDFRKTRNYLVLQQLRLLSAARDGDVFIRLIRGKGVNKYGFAIQLINSEWCDFFYNAQLPNGNEIRMGIEYQWTPFGIREPVAYHLIKRQPADWQWSIPGSFNFASGTLHDRIPASELIHYARYSDADSSRPAPWGSSTIPKSRQLDQYELYECIAARTAACKMGWFYSDINAEGGEVGMPNPQQLNAEYLKATPGGFYGLPYGIKFQDFNPNHPNGNFDNFRKGMVRSWCAGMPGANYNIIANDAEGVSYSTGRIFSLDDRELWKLIQRFDIESAERPIFEAWLEMALLSGAIPLPVAKFTKFNKPHFAGRRWSWVDPAKDAMAVKERLLLGLTSRSRECDDEGNDFDNILFEIAEEEMLIEELGLQSAIGLVTIASAGKSVPPETEPDEDDQTTTEEEKPAQKPAAKSRIASLNGKSHN